MVCSSGFKIPEEFLNKKQEVGYHKDSAGKQVTEKELEERRQQILQDLNISSDDLYHEQHFENV